MSQPLPPHANGVSLSLEELLYYRPHAIKWQRPAKSLWSQMSGVHRSRQKGRGMDFEESRQYQAGDDIRNIDWRVTARTGKAHTKLFSEDKEKSVMLYLDLRSPLHFGSLYLFKSVQLCHFASVLIWLTIANKDRIGAVINTGDSLIEFKPSSLQQHALKILHTIIKEHNKISHDVISGSETQDTISTTTSNEIIKTLHHLAPKGSDIILLSDFAKSSIDEIKAFRYLNQHNTVRLIQVYDPLEYGETHFKGTAKASDGKFSQWLDFGSKKKKHALKTAFEDHQRMLKQQCLRAGMEFDTLSCGEPLLSQITKRTT